MHHVKAVSLTCLYSSARHIVHEEAARIRTSDEPIDLQMPEVCQVKRGNLKFWYMKNNMI